MILKGSLFTVETNLGTTRELWTVAGTYDDVRPALEHARKLIEPHDHPPIRVVDQSTGKFVTSIRPAKRAGDR